MKKLIVFGALIMLIILTSGCISPSTFSNIKIQNLRKIQLSEDNFFLMESFYINQKWLKMWCERSNSSERSIGDTLVLRFKLINIDQDNLDKIKCKVYDGYERVPRRIFDAYGNVVSEDVYHYMLPYQSSEPTIRDLNLLEIDYMKDHNINVCCSIENISTEACMKYTIKKAC